MPDATNGSRMPASGRVTRLPGHRAWYVFPNKILDLAFSNSSALRGRAHYLTRTDQTSRSSEKEPKSISNAVTGRRPSSKFSRISRKLSPSISSIGGTPSRAVSRPASGVKVPRGRDDSFIGAHSNDVRNLDVTPMRLQVFGDQSPVTVMRLVFSDFLSRHFAHQPKDATRPTTKAAVALQPKKAVTAPQRFDD